MSAPKGHLPYNKNGEGGRPIKYTQEFLDKESRVLEEWMKDKNNLFIEDFCFDRGYHESRIDEFVKANERFSLAYNRFKMKQKSALFSGGLRRKFAHPMCALILSHNHGVYQKTEQKVISNTLDPLEWIVGNIDGNSKDLVNG